MMFCAAVLAVVFATAASSKVRGRAAFADFTGSLPRFGLPRTWPRRPVGLAIVLTEVAIVGLLFVVPLVGFALAAGLLMSFSAGIGIALRRGDQVACRCFGSSGRVVGAEHLVRNGILVVVAVAGALSVAWPIGSPETALQVLWAVLGSLSGLLVTRWDDLMFIVRGARPSHS